MTLAAVESPCVNLCLLDACTGWCRGCGRTLDEIGGWVTADDARRRAIVARLPERMAALLAESSPSPVPSPFVPSSD